jgi:hypothetical protein
MRFMIERDAERDYGRWTELTEFICEGRAAPRIQIVAAVYDRRGKEDRVSFPSAVIDRRYN